MNLDKDSQYQLNETLQAVMTGSCFKHGCTHRSHAKSVHVKFRLHLGHLMIPSISPYASAALLNQVVSNTPWARIQNTYHSCRILAALKFRAVARIRGVWG